MGQQIETASPYRKVGRIVVTICRVKQVGKVLGTYYRYHRWVCWDICVIVKPVPECSDLSSDTPLHFVFCASGYGWVGTCALHCTIICACVGSNWDSFPRTIRLPKRWAKRLAVSYGIPKHLPTHRTWTLDPGEVNTKGDHCVLYNRHSPQERPEQFRNSEKRDK